MIGIFFFQAEDGIRDLTVTGVQTCALPIFKVDCGLHRAGVDPASPYALSVARELGEERGLVFDGIVSHSGHAYRTTSKPEAAVVAESERSEIGRASCRERV